MKFSWNSLFVKPWCAISLCEPLSNISLIYILRFNTKCFASRQVQFSLILIRHPRRNCRSSGEFKIELACLYLTPQNCCISFTEAVNPRLDQALLVSLWNRNQEKSFALAARFGGRAQNSYR